MGKQLLIAIDPGFDSMKVIANGQHFKFPFSAIETDERKMSDYGSRKDFFLYKDDTGATWRIGKYARDLIYENKSGHDDPMQGFYTEDRFVSSEFTVGIRAAIAKAIDLLGLYEEQEELDIRIIVALPHATREKYTATVTGLVAGEHHFYMVFDNQPERPYHFFIKEKNAFTVSQTIAAILGETSDDNGNINEDKFFYLSNGPTLVIDGGYYTIGLVPLSSNGSVDDERSESNTAFAMKNVNMRVAKELSERRPDIKHYAVEHLLSKEESSIRYMKNGRVETINLADLRSMKIHDVCSEFIQYLDRKFDHLLDFRYILVTGGTGACYYNQLLDYYKSTGLMDEQHLLLTNPVINNVSMSIEFAIAAGAYKGLCGKL